MLLLIKLQQYKQRFLKTEPRFAQLLSNIHQQIKGYSISFELFSSEQNIFFYMDIPEKINKLMIWQIYALYPDCIIEKQKNDYLEKVKSHNNFAVMTQLKNRCSNIYPWKRFDEFEWDSLASIFTVLSKTSSTEQIAVQIIISPQEDNYIFNLERYFKRIKTTSLKFIHFKNKLKYKIQDNFYDLQKTAINTKAEELQYKVSINVAVFWNNESEIKEQKIAIEKAFTQFNSVDFNWFKNWKILHNKKAFDLWKTRKSKKTLHMWINELAWMYYYPDPHIIPHLVHVLSCKSQWPIWLPKKWDKNVVTFWNTNFHNQNKEFGILYPDRERHMYVIWKSWNWKSKFLELLIKKDIEEWKWVCVMDPHWDLVDSVIKHIPENRIKDVVYFNPMDIENPVPFNPLEAVSPELKMRVTIWFIEIFKKLFSSNWTSRLEHMLRQTVLALLDTEWTTVFSILKMLSDKTYRQKIVWNIKDSVVKNFWVNEFAAWSEKFDHEAIMPLLNKVWQLVSTDLIRNIVWQSENTFNIREIMDNQKIFLVKLNKWLLWEENAELLWAMLITKIQQAALERWDTQESDRNPFYLYCDEFQYFATETFTEILSEARKYKLFLTVAHQYMWQLIPSIRDTIFGNIWTIISFRIGADDATLLEREFNPIFSSQDIINLWVREFYIKMSINWETHNAFSAKTLDIKTPKNHFEKRIIQESRDRYSKNKYDVEKKLKKWDESSNNSSINENTILNKKFKKPLVSL